MDPVLLIADPLHGGIVSVDHEGANLAVLYFVCETD